MDVEACHGVDEMWSWCHHSAHSLLFPHRRSGEQIKLIWRDTVLAEGRDVFVFPLMLARAVEASLWPGRRSRP